MIVPQKRFTVIGLDDDRERALAGLQAIGALHLTPLRAGEPPITRRPQEAEAALKWLASCPDRYPRSQDLAAFDLEEATQAALANQDRLQYLYDRKVILKQYVKQLTPWGEFTFPDLKDIGGHRFWFYKIPNYKMRQMAESGLTWQEVHRDHRNSYVVALSQDLPDESRIPAKRMRTGGRALAELRHEIDEIDVAIEDAKAERRRLSRWVEAIQAALDAKDDEAALQVAAGQTLEQPGFFALQGWAPAEREDEIVAFCEGQGLACAMEAPTPEDAPPTFLRNPEHFGGGEELVTFYQMPGYHTWDPSLVVFFSFLVFFAMILSDAGYGLVLGLITLLSWGGLKKSKAGKRVGILGLWLSLFSMIYGVLAGSYFGVLPPYPLLERLKVLDMNDFGSMMFLSVVVGVLHLIMANLIKAWQQRGHPRARVPVGWALALTGGFLALGTSLVALGTIKMLIGAGLILIYSSERKVTGPLSALQRAAESLLGLASASQAFGDVLSYMRLFALGLASSSLALTFNSLAGDIAAASATVGVVGAGAMLLIGHSLNFALGMLGGVVHGLRLNVIEFFNWSLDEEGYAYQPFRRKGADRD